MENYEKKYKEALERAQQVHATNVDENKKSTEYIFPELRESEDERIRKGLIENFSNMAMFSNWGAINKIQVSDIIAWFEKQGEQILANSEKTCKDEQNTTWGEEDEKIMKRIDSLLYSQCTIHGSEYEKLHNWLKSIKPHWKPSEKQMKHLKSISVGWHPSLDDCRILSSLYNDLKTL